MPRKTPANPSPEPSTPTHHHPSRRDILQLLGLASLAPFADRLALAQTLTGPAATTPKYFGHFAELPVGANKPLGWTQSWLQRQAAGLTGHPENMAYPFDTCMLAGHIPAPSVAHGDNWWRYEQSGYFFDGVTRLSHLIDDPTVASLHQHALDNILANSSDRGYGASIFLWPNAVIGRGMIADYSATKSPAQKAAIAALIERVVLTHPWPYGREGVNAETGLYLYSATGNPRFLDLALQAYTHYTTADDSFCSAAKINGTDALKSHGVTAAETLKMLALMYLYSGDPEALHLTSKAFNKVIAQGLMPDGAPVSSEDLGTAVFNSLHETCDISDWTWSMGYCLMATGDAKWADIIERAIFNALPGAVTKDFKQFQYFSCANQILATSTSSHNTMTRMSYRAAHDTECCGGNVNRAMPNFVIRQWMKSPPSAPTPGLYAILYGPSVLTTDIAGHPITITQTTDYPFRDTITFKLQTPKPILFDLHLRIPGWCTSATLSINGQPVTTKLDPGTFVTISRRFKPNDLIELTLPMQLHAEPWFKGESIAITRGPLVYSLQIDEHRVELTKDTPHVESHLNGNLIQGFPAVEFTPQSEWRFAVDPTLIANLAQIKVVESPMTPNPFETGQSPVHLELPLRRLPAWQPKWTPQPENEDARVVTPATLPSTKELLNPDPATPQKLVPYGSTHIRLTTLPLLSADTA
jgi:hypothetical protein